MKIDDCGDHDEIFTHEDPDAGLIRHFNATRLADYAFTHKEIERVVIEIEPSHADFIRTNRGIEQWKLDRLKEPWLSKPAIFVDIGDGFTLTVDGHHRYVRRHELGLKEITGYRFKLGQWEQFLVDDVPQYLNLEKLAVAENILKKAGIIPSG